MTTPNDPSWMTGQHVQHRSVPLTVGSGAPTASTPGSFYFRTDTPATANQRLYVKNGSAWTGIL